MLDIKVKYYPTNMLGWRDGHTYPLAGYHVYPLSNLANLTLEEANMVSEFMNSLVNPQSIRAIQAKLLMTRGKKGLDRLLGGDVLCLQMVEGAIVWGEGSLLEELENAKI